MRRPAAIAAVVACLSVAVPANALDSSDCREQLERTATALPRLELERGAQPQVLNGTWCHLSDVNDLVRGGFHFPAQWRYTEDGDAAEFELVLGPWELNPGAPGVHAYLHLAQPASSDVIVVESAWAGWDKTNAFALQGEIIDVRRDSLAGRQMSRGWARMPHARVVIRSGDGFAEWIAESISGKRDLSALVTDLDALPLTASARAALSDWAGQGADERPDLKLRIDHPEGARIVALWNWLLFSEVDAHGHLGATLDGLRIDVADARLDDHE